MNAITNLKNRQVINGINVAAVRQLAAEVAADRKKGMTNWRVSTAWRGQALSRSTIDGFDIGGRSVVRSFAIDIDEPLELAGSNQFPNPQEYLLAALNACMTVGYVAQCALRGIELESLEIETTGDIDLRGFLGVAEVPAGYEQLNYTVRIKGNGTEAEFAEVHEAVVATSPNFHNITKAVKLAAKLIVE